MFELYILLSDRCNFACGHCLNSSGLTAGRWKISPDEIAMLAETVNSNQTISQIHFTGGEPSLFLEAIIDLQRRVSRTVLYAMTSNGSFKKSKCNPIGSIKLDEIILSYDRFHRPFITPDEIIEVASDAKQHGISVVVNSVFGDVLDLAAQAVFLAHEIPVVPSRMVYSGRAKTQKTVSSWKDASCLTQTCPSIQREQRRNEREKIMFIPGKGFTPCCGPLVFDNVLDECQLYTNTFDQYATHPLRKHMQCGSMEQQAVSLGTSFGKSIVQNTCEACLHLYGRLGLQCPSVATLVQQIQDTVYYPIQSKVPELSEQLLSTSFTVAYLYTLPIQKLQNLQTKNLPASDEIEIVPIDEESRPGAVEFMIANYYTQFPSHYSKKSISVYRELGLYYLSLTPIAHLYKKQGRIVGAIFAHLYSPHPAINKNTIHVGYWGYDRTLVSREEARWIKAHWLKSLAKWGKNQCAVDASVDCFNATALKFVETLGFDIRCLRLEKKADQ